MYVHVFDFTMYMYHIRIRVSFGRRGGGGGGIYPPPPPPWNLFANMYTTITLYVAPQSLFKFMIRPPLTNFLNESLTECVMKRQKGQFYDLITELNQIEPFRYTYPNTLQFHSHFLGTTWNCVQQQCLHSSRC